MCASDAYDALYAAKYDLIISDIMMPEIDGFEFAQTVRETDPNAPILFMTAKDDMPSKSKGYLLGIDDYMVKPIDLEELVLHVGALFRRAGIAQSKELTIEDFTMNAEELTVSQCRGAARRPADVLFRAVHWPAEGRTHRFAVVGL